MKTIFLSLILFCSFISYGQEHINCVVNNTVMFISDPKKSEYVIVSRHKELSNSIDYMLMFVVPECNNIIVSFNGEEKKVLYNPKKKQYQFDGEIYKSFGDLLLSIKLFLLSN
jgi:hypothetical protein